MDAREFIKQAFCDNGQPSSSRLLTAITVLCSSFALVFVAVKTKGIPDGTALTGLGAFAGSPYGINRLSKMFGKDKDKDTTVVDTSVIVKNP